MIGYAFCGSFCTMKKSVGILCSLAKRGYDLLPVMSFNAFTTDTRFGTAEGFVREISDICKKAPVTTIADAEPLGPKTPLDALIICPCTGNTLAKLASGITDTPVTMAAKAHMRQSRPLLIALASNDAMSTRRKSRSPSLPIFRSSRSALSLPFRENRNGRFFFREFIKRSLHCGCAGSFRLLRQRL